MNYKKLFTKAKQRGISDLELYITKSKKFSINVFHSNVENYNVAENEVLSARGIVNGKMGVAYTENLTDLDTILNQIVENANIIEEKKEPCMFEGGSKYSRGLKCSDSFSKATPAEKIKLAMEGEKLAMSLDKRIVEVGGSSYSETETSVTIINSKGLKVASKNCYAMYDIEVVAKENDDTKTAFDYQFVSSFDQLDIDKVVKSAVNQAVNKLNASPCKSKKYKIVLDSDVFASLINIFTNSVIGENVNKGKSLLKDKLHEVVASKKLTLIENPLCRDYPYFFRAFDDEGVPTYKKNIINKGVLETFLYNLESAKEANTKSTGNGYKAGALAPVRTDVSFLEVKNGKKTRQQLFEKIKNGLYITEVAGLHAGIDAISGNFSLQSSGFIIADGKIEKPVNLITIAGNLFDMFKDIVEVGCDSRITYGSVKSPSVIIKSLAVSGK